MIYRVKGSSRYEMLDRKGLLGFLKMNTTESGKLTGQLEAVQPGLLVKGKDDGSEWIPWVFSTFDTDRFDERVDPAGWELERYAENPVVLWAHCHSIPAIGTAEGVQKGENLGGRIRFNAKEYDPFGWAIGERVKNGVIRCGSVGFIVKEIEWVDHKKNPDETCDLIIRKQELLEFSICNVPANPFAIRKDSLGEFGFAEFSTAGGMEKDLRRERSLIGMEGTGGPTVRSFQDELGGHWPLLMKSEYGGRHGRCNASCP